MLSKKKLLLAGLSLYLTLSPLTAQACTLYAAAGKDYVAGGGTLVAKNRDFRPLGDQALELVKPTAGLRYYKLTGVVSNHARIAVCGINEKGLYVGNSAASNLDKDLRAAIKGFRSAENLSATEYLLRYCSTVDEALAHKEVFRGAQNLILADRNKIAFVELLPNNTHAVRTEQKGFLYHTNHYVTPEGLPFNEKVGQSSFRRYFRIGQLLAQTVKPMTIQDFIGFSEDRHFDSTTSIYRTGKGPRSEQTLAVFIAHIPKKGSPEIYVKYRVHPDEQGKEKIIGPEKYNF